MGSVPSRIVGVLWIDDIETSKLPSARFSLTSQPTVRFHFPRPTESIVPADLGQLETELQAAFELASCQ
jgi:hypothetical protein